MSEIMLVDRKDFDELEKVAKHLEKMVNNALSNLGNLDAPTLEELKIKPQKEKEKLKKEEQLLKALDYLWEFSEYSPYKKNLMIVEDWIWEQRRKNI